MREIETAARHSNNNFKFLKVMEHFNHDEQAEKYLQSIGEKDSYTQGDMETCFVMGCQVASELQEGSMGSFGQAIGSLKHGKLVARQGWNGKGMFLFMRPFDTLKDDFIIDTVKSLSENFKLWVKNHPNEKKERFFTEYICMKAANGSVVNGWNATQVDMLSEDWVLVDPNE